MSNKSLYNSYICQPCLQQWIRPKWWMMMMSSFSQDRDRPRVVKYKNAVENSQAKFGPNREGRGWRFGVRESGEYGRWVGVSGFSREESLVWCRDSSLQFLLNYSSTEGQGQACSESAAVYVCSSGKCTLIHTWECYEHSCKLEQRICVLFEEIPSSKRARWL